MVTRSRNRGRMLFQHTKNAGDRYHRPVLTSETTKEKVNVEDTFVIMSVSSSELKYFAFSLHINRNLLIIQMEKISDFKSGNWIEIKPEIGD